MEFNNMIFANAEVGNAILTHDSGNQAQGTATADMTIGGASAQDGIGWGMSTLLIYTVVIGFMWMVVFRPQKKRAKQLKEMHEGIKVGDNVVTSGGLYGKIVDVGTNVYVLEFGMNKGVRIPVDKNDIVAIREPDLTTPKADDEDKK